MYFYIFFVVYLANNFSNGLLFRTNPLNQNNELIDAASSGLKSVFSKNTTDPKGMKYEEFANILKEFDWLYEIPPDGVKLLFSKIVGNLNGFMNLDQFKKLATYCIIHYEENIEKHFTTITKNKKKMNFEELKKALEPINFPYPDENLIILMYYFEREGAEVISMKAFRNIFAFIFHERYKKLKQENCENESTVDCEV
ncbi:uncharacterized protein LOC126901299 isoform X1 [Daktulosphaira vitifoliae]|uniref:uncharacterized protein LOC126901299 isoform X1 n=1 Tax=Daktulosphaira vitifoliae TaxID=58002 RepID=UPI0021A996EE|nr:uncharacterized protein LOC126901299 isoform X1 [Daktulosphaira vitifoliae]